jgi:hypothetical protein
VASNFRAAYAVMSATAVLADVNNHHPLWTNVYNSLNVALSTDDKGCLSDYDFYLARGMESVYGNYSCGSDHCNNSGLCDPGLSVPVCTCAPHYSGASCSFNSRGIPGISSPPGWLDQPNAPALLVVSILLGLQSLYVGWSLLRNFVGGKGPTGSQPIYAAVGEGYGT